VFKGKYKNIFIEFKILEECLKSCCASNNPIIFAATQEPKIPRLKEEYQHEDSAINYNLAKQIR